MGVSQRARPAHTTWRFPVIPVLHDSVDLLPWKRSMAGCGENGGCFRAFTVEGGDAYSIVNATGWCNRVAASRSRAGVGDTEGQRGDAQRAYRACRYGASVHGADGPHIP